MNTKHVDGITVVGVGAGERLGRVTDLLLDPEGRQVMAFVVHTGGGGVLAAEPSETVWLAAKDVHAIGPDALTVDDATCLRDSPPKTETLRVSDLLKRKVVTEGGTYVGPIASFDFDERRMKITDIETSAGFFKSNRFVSTKHLISVGEEFVVVSDAVCAPGSDRDAAESEHSRIVGDVESSSTISQ